MDAAFADLDQLMRKAGEMVQLAQYFRERVARPGERVRAAARACADAKGANPGPLPWHCLLARLLVQARSAHTLPTPP
jgi:hypothetical protein